MPNYHTPHAFGAPLTSAEVNAPLASLDAQMTRDKYVFNVLDHAPARDGVTDDSPSIQAACDAADAVGGGIVVVPDGVYYCDSSITLYQGTHLVGVGRAGQQFLLDGTQSTVLKGKLNTPIIITEGTDLVGGNPAVSGRKENYSIRGIRFVNADAASAGLGALVKFNYAYDILVEDCIFAGTSRGGTAGLVLNNSGQAVIRNCRFEDFPQHSTESQTRAPIEISPTNSGFTGGFPIQMIDIYDCVFSYCGRGIDVGMRDGTANDGIHIVRVDSCFFKKSANDPFDTDLSTGIHCTGAESLSISNIKFEDVRRPIDLLASRNVRISNVQCHHAEYVVDVQTSKDVQIDGLNLISSTGNPLTTGVHFNANNTGYCSLMGWARWGDTASSIIVIDNDAGLFGGPAALAPIFGSAHNAFVAWAATNRAVYVPVEVRRSAAVLGAVIAVGTQSGNICVGIYDAAGTRLATSGSVACPAAGRQVVNFSSTAYITPGTYYMALSCDNTTATFGTGNPAATATTGLTQFEALGGVALPSTATFAGAASNLVNVVGRVQGGWL